MKHPAYSRPPTQHVPLLGRRRLLRVGGAAALAGAMSWVPAAARAQAGQGAAYEIRFSPLVRHGALGFVAQDLSVARNDPADPNGDLGTYVQRALQSFAAKRGHMPETELDRVVAMADWIADNMRHPAFYPEDPDLPRLYATQPHARYGTLANEPVRLLNFTLAHDPEIAATWPAPQCTQQHFALAGLLNYLGLHARLVEVEGHTGLEYYSFELYKWIWLDATHNEHYIDENGASLGVIELNQRTLFGGIERVRPVKHGYPTERYPFYTYLRSRPHGFRQYAAMRYMNIFGGKGSQLSLYDTVVYSPVPPPTYQPLPGEVLNFDRLPEYPGWYEWPKTDSAESLDVPLGRVSIFEGLEPTEAGLALRLRSYLPFTQRFQLNLKDRSAHWETVQTITKAANGATTSDPIVIPWGSGAVQIRAVDNVHNVSLPVALTLRA